MCWWGVTLRLIPASLLITRLLVTLDEIRRAEECVRKLDGVEQETSQAGRSSTFYIALSGPGQLCAFLIRTGKER